MFLSGVTFLFAADLRLASLFLARVGLPVSRDARDAGGDGCVYHQIGPRSEVAACNTRPPPPSMDAAAITVTLVVPSRRRVDEWHAALVASGINATKPAHSAAFNCYACEPRPHTHTRRGPPG